jgi:SAM-dependent methyltransferase
MKYPGSAATRAAIRGSAGLLSWLLPLEARKSLVVGIERYKFRWGADFSMGALADLRQQNPEVLHRFLWSNHLAYAARYEVAQKFAPQHLNPTRRILFRQILAYFRSRGLDAREQIRSVLEVGCSLGYLLRHIELHMFPEAAPLHGIDIDRYAVETGKSYLRSVNSRVELFEADMTRTGEITGNRPYDLVLCCGVLMYVNEKTARETLGTMFALSRRLAGIICLAPGANREATPSSEIRNVDGAYVHDIHRMIRESGGSLVSSTFVDTATSGSSPSHVVLATPPAASTM